jgi:acyl-CoA synthetase (AMP-forming)/AMP-acid ligase II
MLGYWNTKPRREPQSTQAGWMHTGDLAVRDDN